MFHLLASSQWNLTNYTAEPLYSKSFQYVNEYNQDINISAYWKETKSQELSLTILSEKSAESDEISYSNEYEKDPSFKQTAQAAIMATGKANGKLSVGVNPIPKEFNFIKIDFSSNSSFSKKIESLEGKHLNKVVIIPHENSFYEPARKFTKISTDLEYYNSNSAFFSAAGDKGESGADSASIPHNNLPEVGIITATTKYGKHASYSQTSSMALLNAPASGVDFYNSTGNENTMPGMTESDFVQTSGAAGIVAGLASIIQNRYMRETNEQTFMRLALTSSINDPSDNLWIKNAAGVFHSPLYGFGRPRSYSLQPSANSLGIDMTDEHGSRPRPAFSNTTTFSIPFGSSFPREIEFKAASTSADAVSIMQVEITSDYVSQDDLRIDVTSPSNTTVRIFKGTKGPGHIKPPGPKGKLTTYVFGTRAFLGEPINGTWKVKAMHMTHMPLDTATFKIVISGFKTDGIKTYQVNSTVPHNKEATLEVTPHNFTCLTDVTIKAPNDIKSRAPVYLIQVGGDGGKYQVDTIEPGETRNISIPCLFEPSLKYHLLIEAPNPNNNGALIQYESDDLTILNPYEYPQVINYQNYISFGQGKNYSIKYARRGKIHNHHSQFAMVGIYDQHKRLVRMLDAIPDTGILNLNFGEDEEIMYRPVLSIQSFDADDSECPVLFPFHLYKKEETSVLQNYLYDVFVDKDRCPYLHKAPFWTEEVRRLTLPIEGDPAAYRQGLLSPFTTVGLTIISSIIYYYAVERKKKENEIDKELGGSFVP